MTQRIVVVEDTDEILMLISEILVEEGYAVVPLVSPVGALEKIIEFRPDLIILDHLFGQVPRGRQLFHALRQHDTTVQIPVVVCTGAANVHGQLDGYLEDPDVALLRKPFDLDDLLGVVQQMLSR